MQEKSEWGDEIVLATSGKFENANAIFMHLCQKRAPTDNQMERFNAQRIYLDEVCFKVRQ